MERMKLKEIDYSHIHASKIDPSKIKQRYGNKR